MTLSDVSQSSVRLFPGVCMKKVPGSLPSPLMNVDVSELIKT